MMNAYEMIHSDIKKKYKGLSFEKQHILYVKRENKAVEC